MTAEEMSKYVAEQFAKGSSITMIARSLGVSEEYLFRKIAKTETDKEDRNE